MAYIAMVVTFTSTMELVLVPEFEPSFYFATDKDNDDDKIFVCKNGIRFPTNKLGLATRT